jgi:hypothetical protein
MSNNYKNAYLLADILGGALGAMIYDGCRAARLGLPASHPATIKGGMALDDAYRIANGDDGRKLVEAAADEMGFYQ